MMVIVVVEVVAGRAYRLFHLGEHKSKWLVRPQLINFVSILRSFYTFLLIYGTGTTGWENSASDRTSILSIYS